MMKTPIKAEDRVNHVLKLTQHASESLFDQWRASEFCVCHRVAGTLCHVKFEHKEEERGRMKENHKVMTYKNHQFIRKQWLLPRLESTRTVEVFTCRNIGQRVAEFSCGLHEKTGLKCRHMFAVFDELPVETGAIYHHWLDFDLAFLGKGLEPDLLEKNWTAHSAWENTGGSVLPEHIQEVPEFVNDEDIEYFDGNLDKLAVVQSGFWKTRRGASLIQKAEFIAKSRKGNNNC
jgi:hypothetical protein